MQTAKFQICLRDRVVWLSTTLSVAIIAGQWRTRADCTSVPTNPKHRCLHMSRNVRNRTFWYLRPARPKSANLTRIIVALMKKHPWLSKQMRKMKILIRLQICRLTWNFTGCTRLTIRFWTLRTAWYCGPFLALCITSRKHIYIILTP